MRKSMKCFDFYILVTVGMLLIDIKLNLNYINKIINKTIQAKFIYTGNCFEL